MTDAVLAAAPATVRKTSLVHTAGYGISEYGKSLFIASLNLVWLFFLTDIVGIPAAVGGFIIMVLLAWDAVTDPIAGYLADRTRTRWGKYRPWLIVGAPLTALSFVLTYVKPPFDYQTTIVYVFITAMLLRTAYTMIDVPHNALMALATRSSKERATLAGAKMLCGGLGGLTVSLAIAPVLKAEGIGEEAGRFLSAALIGGAIAIATMMVCVLAFRDVDNRETAKAAPPPVPFLDFFRVLSGNPNLYIVFGVWVVGMMTLPSFSKSILYFSKYHLHDDAWGGVALATMTVGQAGCIPLWIWAAHKFDKARLVQIGQALSIAVLATFLFTEPTDKTFLATLIFLEGVAIGGTFGVAMSMVPDLVEYGEWKTGKRVEAGVFGFHTFAVKVGHAVGAGLVGLLLGMVGFVPNIAQSPETLEGMRLVMTVPPIIGSTLAIAALFFYSLSHETHGRITAEIAARRPPDQIQP